MLHSPFQKKEKNIQVSIRVDGLLRTVSMKATHTEDNFWKHPFDFESIWINQFKQLPSSCKYKDLLEGIKTIDYNNNLNHS